METYGGNNSEQRDPPNCLKFSQVNIYKCTVMNIWKEQVAASVNTYSWEVDINNLNLQALMTKIRKRAPIVSRRNAVEKVDHQMAPFYYVKHLPQIERAFFRRGINPNTRTCLASLRNRFTMLMTLCGLMRGESMEQADLSDLLDFHWKGPRDPHEMHILIMQICQGKTNDDKKIWGRAMRHRDVKMCAIGALALYLWYRITFSASGKTNDRTSVTTKRGFLSSYSSLPKASTRNAHLRSRTTRT